MEQMIRVANVAKLLDVSKKRIYNLITEGKLEAVNLGIRQTRITRESLDRYVSRLRKRRRIELGLEEDDPKNPLVEVKEGPRESWGRSL
jgi:excisionase family DNA binding protein